MMAGTFRQQVQWLMNRDIYLHIQDYAGPDKGLALAIRAIRSMNRIEREYP